MARNMFELLDFKVIDDRLVVDAVVEDMVLLYQQTRWMPAEYGPALCTGTVWLDPDNDPSSFRDLQAVKAYLNATQQEPDWDLQDTSDW